MIHRYLSARTLGLVVVIFILAFSFGLLLSLLPDTFLGYDAWNLSIFLWILSDVIWDWIHFSTRWKVMAVLFVVAVYIAYSKSLLSDETFLAGYVYLFVVALVFFRIAYRLLKYGGNS